MCGRFTLTTPAETIASLFAGLQMPPLKPRYNIAPTQLVSCIRSANATKTKHVLEYVHLRWGLVPSWSKDLKMGARMINARGETVAEKPSFRAAFKRRRCLILADGFYEWKKEGGEKQPYYVTKTDEQPFCMAGLWETWKNKETDETVESCTIITTSANDFMSPLHDRMPVILERENHPLWLDSEFEDRNHLESLLQPFSDEDGLQKRPVNKIVNRPVNDLPECIAPA